MKRTKIDYIVLAWLITIYIGGIITGNIITGKSWREDATVTPCAQYNPVTGDFEWLDGYSQLMLEIIEE